MLNIPRKQTKSLAPPCRRSRVAPQAQPPESFHCRRQYLASALLASVPVPARGNRALGIAGADLYAPGLNFVFGTPDIEGRRAVISLHRLRPEFYGSPPDDTLFLQRAVKEAVHELGHTCRLGHCRDPKCIMFFSNTLHDTDVKGPGFCAACGKKVNRGMSG